MNHKTRRGARGHFVPTWTGEPKKPINIVITPTALERLDALARSQGMSRSECIERYAREAQLPGETATGDSSPSVAKVLCDIATDIAERVDSEQALKLSEERYRSLVEATSALVWTTGPDGEFSTPQPGWESFTGQCWPEYRDWGGMQALHPEDRKQVGEAWIAASASGSPFAAEYRLWHAPSGRYCYVQVRAVPLRDDCGIREWVGTVSDIDERIRREQTGRLLADLEAQMRRCSAVSELTRIVPEAVGRFLGVQRCSWGEWNPADGTVTIYPDYCDGVPSIAGTYPLAAFGPDLVEPHRRGEVIVLCDVETDPRAAKVLEVFKRLSVRAYVSVPVMVGDLCVSSLAVQSVGVPRDWTDDEVVLLTEVAKRTWLVVENIRLQAKTQAAFVEAETARQEAEGSERRAAFLADVSAMLAASLDYKAVLSELTRMAVPVLGDWCAVDILNEAGKLTRLAVAHIDPEKVRWAHELHRFPPDPKSPRGLFNVLRTGKSEWYPQIPDSLLVFTARSPEHLEALRQVGFSSAIIVPLSARGRTLGAMTLVAAESGRRYTEQDLRLAEDLAHRAALAVDNARLYSEAQQANRTKDQFLAVLSHELRTPLNPIIGWSQLLRRGKLDPAAQKRALETIERNAKLQNQLIEDLLDISRIVEGKFSFRPQPTTLSQVVLTAVEAVRHLAESSRVDLEVALVESSPLVLVDPTRMQQVVWNLLTNAIKFTPTGGRVAVALTIKGAQLCLTVTDSGMGIPADFLPHVFEQFRQADGSSTRKQGGLGLGLFIVRHIVELHGGTVEAHSDGEGKGASFTVELPIAIN